MSYQREETRWAKIEMEHRYHEEHNAVLMASDKAKRNASSVAYNPLTLEYNDSYNGEMLKYKAWMGLYSFMCLLDVSLELT